MADEDEVDVLGDFTFDNLFPKEDSRISTCYDGGVLGPQGADQLLHDCINPAWLLEPSQPCWFSPPHEDRQRTSPASADDRSALGFTNLPSAGSPSNWEEGDSWSEREKSLLDKGIELFGCSWSRVAQFVGSKSPQQVRNQARLMGLTGISSVSESSEHQEEEETPAQGIELDTKQPIAFNFSELIDDMAIPASMEEVIAVVTTAQPTVQSHSPSPPHKRQRQISERSNNSIRGNSSRGRNKITKRGRPKKISSQEDITNNITTTHEVESANINTIPSKEQLPIRFVSEGEELIRIKKQEDSEEDSEIDIDDPGSPVVKPIIQEEPTINIKQEIKEEIMEEEKDENTLTIDESNTNENFNSEEFKEQSERIFDLPSPTKEINLDPEFISEEEKLIHHEFFLGRATKTPNRYLKIRNHIIDSWMQNKPRYTSKTSVRSGLRNCGDVNCIGRIHSYLEMVGAINFGCAQTQYRPIIVPLTYARGSLSSAYVNKMKQESKVNVRQEGTRPRKKKMDYLDSDGEGGYTITHDEKGDVIYTKVFLEPRPHKEKKSNHEQLRLVYCQKFSDFQQAPYSVVLDVGALLLMDVHSHSCRSEVIGLLGGSYDTNNKVLHISRGIACKSQSTGVQCDMCPVSQTEASEQLQSAGLEVVGWYHSHPTFLPNPSLQDLDTQLKVQRWFDKTDAPFVGIIVAPYFHGNRTLASSFKCLIVKEEGEDRKPYQFPIQVSASQTCSDSMVNRISDVFSQLGLGAGSEVVPFNEDTNLQPPITYLEKMIESARIHMDQCQPPLSEEEKNNLLSGIIDICEQQKQEHSSI